MIIVPEKTILFVPIIFNDGRIYDGNPSDFIKPLNTNHERDWFDSHFYKCLPLSIGNMQGFVFSAPFDFSVIWDGRDSIDAIQININKDEYLSGHGVEISSEFGKGILTFHLPVILKTPDGVNLMTISPPNFPIPGMSPMTGVVEADNLRFTFTLNLKIDVVDIPINVKKNYPLVGILPIPRYFCDSFTIVNAYDIIDEELIKEEQEVILENKILRHKNNDKIYETKEPYEADRLYYKGLDIRGNKFKDHQLPRKKI